MYCLVLIVIVDCTVFIVAVILWCHFPTFCKVTIDSIPGDNEVFMAIHIYLSGRIEHNPGHIFTLIFIGTLIYICV